MADVDVPGLELEALLVVPGRRRRAVVLLGVHDALGHVPLVHQLVEGRQRVVLRLRHQVLRDADLV